MADIKCLTSDEVVSIHKIVTTDFEADSDPISPAGVRSMALLESTVSRQFTSFGTTLKYPTAIENAVALSYGVRCNHARFTMGALARAKGAAHEVISYTLLTVTPTSTR